ncbi:phosphotransferase enzyme family protein [Swaminathania salitolerans]|uniref:Aminoglycoside phosphotransferase n=1 Tax=Swaminathania salitolerans TaxID=182838 RepID=A0A511BNU1_9PROT|nr:phosphotransferase [Swaminathania salitolerans]GBQ15149.1 aminoglycoside phosphotransferase [Swaminathania salitolerans LMG 21291]GEL02007.1 aminoglycoside phosphotransferase [Swaminathania salitolerans]
MENAGDHDAPGQFGLWKKHAERDWPALTEQEIASVLAPASPDSAATGDRHPSPSCDKTAPFWHSERPFSAAALIVRQGAPDVIVKRHHHGLRSRETLQTEHALIRHLHGRGLPVALPLALANGEDVTCEDPWVYEAFPRLSGRDLYRDRMSWDPYFSVAQARAAGQALARYHDAATGFEAPDRADTPLVSALAPLLGTQPESALRRWVAAQPALEGALDRHDPHGRWLAALAPHLHRAAQKPDSFPSLWGHGDWHGSNLIWPDEIAGGGTDAAPHPDADIVAPCPFDFGMADRTTRPFDIAVALERSMFGWLSPEAGSYRVEWEQIDAFLSGYDRLWPLSGRLCKAIATMLPLAHVTFACSEIWYYDTLLGREDDARTALEDYLIAHAAWFSSPDGRAACDHIARWEARSQKAHRQDAPPGKGRFAG